MTLGVTLLVLFAAILHAGWNAMVRAGDDRLGGMTRLALVTSMISIPLLPFFPFPSRAAWQFLGVTLFLHTAYNFFLAKAYEEGELAKVYPIARGTAPAIVTIMSALFLGERLPVTAFLGIALLVAAILSLAWRDRKAAGGRPVLYALLTSLFIAAYSIVDGVGGRTAQSPHVYVLWLFFLYGYPITAITLWRRGPAFLRDRRGWLMAAGGGLMSMTAYWIVIWAMARAPLGPVSALRETSVVFAVLISGLVLKERLGIRVFAAALAVAAGVALLRL